MEYYLNKAFGLQILQQGWWRGEYVRIMGSPHYQQDNPGLLYLFRMPAILEGRLRHIGFGVKDQSVEAAVNELRDKGVYVDVKGGDIVYGPEQFIVQIDSLNQPRLIDPEDSQILLRDEETDPNLPCIVRGIHHVAIELVSPTRMQDWLSNTFDLDGFRPQKARSGYFISGIYYKDSKPDVIGRHPSLMALYKTPYLSRVRINHISFEVKDTDDTIDLLESRGVHVDQPGDAAIHGPENVWFEIDSRETPFPIDHPANDPGVQIK
jgi:catechol 2,3-dioxygenase-like lactoylglutathione lyase family enzyme